MPSNTPAQALPASEGLFETFHTQKSTATVASIATVKTVNSNLSKRRTGNFDFTGIT